MATSRACARAGLGKATAASPALLSERRVATAQAASDGMPAVPTLRSMASLSEASDTRRFPLVPVRSLVMWLRGGRPGLLRRPSDDEQSSRDEKLAARLRENIAPYSVSEPSETPPRRGSTRRRPA
jgi:hypothetical protein